MENHLSKGPKLNRLLGKLGVCLATILIPAAAGATIIEIEPDDYAEGTDLSNVSPYVTLARTDGKLGSTPEPIYATSPAGQLPSPTGDLSFGLHGAGPVDCVDRVECYAGFSMTFHQPIEWASLYSLNRGYTPGLASIWMAFDAQGDRMAVGTASEDSLNNFGETTLFTVGIPGMRTLLVGGDFVTNALEYDRLQFRLTPVPEPGLLPLFGLSLVGLYFIRRRKNP